MPSYQQATFQLGVGDGFVQDAIKNAKRGDVSAVAIGSIATVLSPASGKRLVFLGGYIGLSANASVLFEDNSAGGGTIFRTPLIAANTPFYFDIGKPYVLSAVDNALKATSSGAASITGTLYYAEI